VIGTFPATVVAEFTGLAAGPHTLTLWMRASHLASNTSLCLENASTNATPLPHSAIVEEMN
jgi:hypothetical protein